MSKICARIGFAICVLCIVIYCSAYAEDLFIYDSGSKRDPFVPLIGDISKAIPDLEDIMTIEDVYLQGIARGYPDIKAAVINGEMIKEGQTVGRLTIKKILKNKIIIAIDENEYTLNIYEEEKIE